MYPLTIKPSIVSLLLFAVLGVVTGSITMTCESKQFTEPPPEWMESHERTPSDILNLEVQLQLFEKRQIPVLNISWTISPDESRRWQQYLDDFELFLKISPNFVEWESRFEGLNGLVLLLFRSIQELRATMICIQYSRNICFRCNYNTSFKKERNPQNQAWHFHAGYPAEPSTTYFVTAFNIPPPNIGEFPPEKSKSISTPSCYDVAMKNHKKCQDANWNPNMSVCMINNDVVINFTTSANSLKYDVHLLICDRISTPILNETTIPQSNGSRISIMFVRNDQLDLSVKYCVILKPYFPECHHYCLEREKVLNCSKKIGHGPMVFGFTVLSVLLFALGAGLFVVCILGKANRRILFNNDAQLLQPVKVLIVYSLDSTLFQNVVLNFAELLQSSNDIQIIIDMWQKRNIAEMGPAQWLALQKENADKVIIVCSKGAKMKWDAICHKTNLDQKMNSWEDMYSIALNIFCSDLQNGSHLHKYSIVHFDEISSAKDIPSIFNSCVQYCLGKDINKFYKDLYGASQNTSGKRAILMPYHNYKIQYNHKMKFAILELKHWQNINPI